MSSILNSISSGNLLVLTAPIESPVKNDSIIELLINSEIEFETCPKFEDKLLNINTGFGENNDLHYETPCNKPLLKTPLYAENYLREFVTEEEKAAARHALGLYNKGDIVAMSLLTTDTSLPSQEDWNEVTIHQMKKGDKFFTPITSFSAVYDSKGNTLDVRLLLIQNNITELLKEILQITQVSKSSSITSLGDVKLFLQGFNNGDNLHKTLEDMNQEMIRFEKTGLINI